MLIGGETRECWNCGRSYDPDEHESCPSCGEHFSNNPSFDVMKDEIEEIDEDILIDEDDDDDDEDELVNIYD